MLEGIYLSLEGFCKHLIEPEPFLKILTEKKKRETPNTDGQIKKNYINAEIYQD